MSELSSKRVNVIRLSSLVLYFAVGILVYSPGCTGKYFSDDFKFVFETPSSKLLYYFCHENPHASWYRPIEAMILSVIQMFAGLNSVPVHLVILLCHILCAWLVYLYMEFAGYQKLASLAGGVFMLVSQANAFAVLSIDTFSQVGGTLAGWTAIWFLWRAVTGYGESGAVQVRPLLLSILFFALSLLMKETSVGFFPAVIMLLLLQTNKRRSSLSVRKLVALLLPYAAICAMYLITRSSVLHGEADSRYTIRFGVNIITNLGSLVAAAIVPISSVSVFQAFNNGEYLRIGAVICGTLVFAALVSYGVWKDEKRNSIMVLSLIGLSALLPTILIAHVSELYVYTAMPIVSIIVGHGLASTYRLSIVALRRLVIVLGAVFLFSHVLAIQGKATLMKENGEQASVLITQVVPFIDTVPKGGTLVLMNPPIASPEYSIYLINGFNVLKYGMNILNYVSGRTDFKAWIIEQKDLKQWLIPKGSVVLTIVQGRISPM